MIRLRATACSHCGGTFEWLENTDLGDTPRVYCGKSCRTHASQARRTTDVSNAVGEDIRLLSCVRCGIPFAWSRPTDEEEEPTPPRYHSITCQTAGKKARRKARNRAEATQTSPHSVRVVAESDAARALLLPAGRCTTCGKVANSTEQAAKDSKAAIERRSGHMNAVRYYQCPDGWWHWTSREATKDAYRRRIA